MSSYASLYCTTDRTKFESIPSVKQCQNPCVYQNLSMCYSNIGLLSAIVNLLIRFKEKLKCIQSGNSLGPLETKKKGYHL